MLRLQQVAGNAAVGRWLQRTPDRIVSITVDLRTSSVVVSVDDGTTVSGSLRRTNLHEGEYTARWDDAAEGLVIEPWATRGEVIYFEVSGTREFLRRYDQLRRAMTAPTPLSVVSSTPETAPSRSARPDPRGNDIVYLSPEEAQERCQTGDLPNIMTFPLRMPRGLWRVSIAPISAHREGEEIVVSQPVNAVYGDPMFTREVRTLPLETFIGGVRLRPNEIVRVRLYDDDDRVVCVTGEGMLRLSEATDTAVLIGILGTALEAGTLFVPVGLIARPILGAARTVTAAAMIGTAEAVPVLAGRAAPQAMIEAVEHRAVTAAVSEATTRAVTSAAQEMTHAAMLLVRLSGEVERVALDPESLDDRDEYRVTSA